MTRSRETAVIERETADQTSGGIGKAEAGEALHAYIAGVSAGEHPELPRAVLTRLPTHILDSLLNWRQRRTARLRALDARGGRAADAGDREALLARAETEQRREATAARIKADCRAEIKRRVAARK